MKETSTPGEKNTGFWVEFKRGWWARCLGPNKDRTEDGQASSHYHSGVTEEEAKELERRVDGFLGKKGWPDGDAQVEIMRGGQDVKITVGGSTHVRSIREWHALAVRSFAASEIGAPDGGVKAPPMLDDDRIMAWVRILKVADDGRAYPNITPMDVEACVRGAVKEQYMLITDVERDLSARGTSSMQEAYDKLAVEVSRLQELINTPELEDFLQGVKIEAAHQVERWGDAHDRSKSAENWYWLVGYLAGKALRSSIANDREKALHHTISSAAALFQWHKAIARDTSGAGLGNDQDLTPAEVKR